jgi:hypothetical protein
MRAAQLSRCAALLLLLGAAIATVPGRPTVMDIRSGRSPRPQSVSTASASQADPSSESYGWHGDEKEVIQRAGRRISARYWGCSCRAACEQSVFPEWRAPNNVKAKSVHIQAYRLQFQLSKA